MLNGHAGFALVLVGEHALIVLGDEGGQPGLGNFAPSLGGGLAVLADVARPVPEDNNGLVLLLGLFFGSGKLGKIQGSGAAGKTAQQQGSCQKNGFHGKMQQ